MAELPDPDSQTYQAEFLADVLKTTKEQPAPRPARPGDELKAMRGNPTHGVGGVHIAYRATKYGWWPLCGVRATVQNCRCRPWTDAHTTEVTCRECYDRAKAMHEATEG